VLQSTNQQLLMLPFFSCSPASDIQAMARIYRQGQTKPCCIYRMFTSGTVEEVICQRQIQKGNLATRAVDGSLPKSGGNATSFSTEELRECFILKKNCECDTKAKVGNRWPEYTGAESIEDQGCTDQPLLAVASDGVIPLSFVHVVREAEVQKVQGADNLSDSEDDDALLSSEEEFEVVREADVQKEQGADNLSDSEDDDALLSSEEEFEF
jgi:DNA repair and recombination RAD54-like protein